MSPAADESASAPARGATYQDALDAPAHRVAEIVDGTLYTHPRLALRACGVAPEPDVRVDRIALNAAAPKRMLFDVG